MISAEERPFLQSIERLNLRTVVLRRVENECEKN